MNQPEIRFDDGAAYEVFMGVWSRSVGTSFIDWLAPARGLHWVDIGCGNGAFSELLLDRAAAASVHGIDPSDGQLAYARTRCADRPVTWDIGSAMALPYPDRSFDAAVMALVLFFVPEPVQGTAEMVRVVRPGGSVSAYAWDMPGGGFPLAILQEEMARAGVPPTLPPSSAASSLDAMQALWEGAGLVDIETRVFAVERTFPGFDAYWTNARTGPRVAPALNSMADDTMQRLRERVRQRLVTRADGSITCRARANAVRGHVPA